MIVKILILLALIKLLKVSESVTLCAVIYGVVALIFTLASNGSFAQAVIAGLIGGALSYLYFWLLHKTENSWLWWIVLVGGLAIGLA
jgi:hypothetical protein